MSVFENVRIGNTEKLAHLRSSPCKGRMVVARQFTGGKRIEKDPSALPKACAQHRGAYKLFPTWLRQGTRHSCVSWSKNGLSTWAFHYMALVQID
jgi:hypothetical protein